MSQYLDTQQALVPNTGIGKMAKVFQPVVGQIRAEFIRIIPFWVQHILCRIPGTNHKPVMIYTHGGSWNAGDKLAIGKKAKFFTDSNYVFVSINYRLSPNPADTLDAARIKFPDHPNDVAKAYTWVINNIHSYSGDTSRISVIGHSAGAHLTLLLSSDQSYLANEGQSLSKIKCSCSLDAGAHHINYYMNNYVIPNNQNGQLVTYVNAFTSNPTTWTQASPYTYLSTSQNIPHFLLVHQGNTERVDLNQHFGTAATAQGIPVNYFNATPMSHEEINQAVGYDTTLVFVQNMNNTISTFYKNCLASYQTTTGIYESAIKNQLAIYPNPANTILNLTCKDGYQIFDLTGLLIRESKSSADKIFIGDLPQGLYIIKTETKFGRFIKQ